MRELKALALKLKINSLVFREELEWQNKKRPTSNGIMEK